MYVIIHEAKRERIASHIFYNRFTFTFSKINSKYKHDCLCKVRRNYRVEFNVKSAIQRWNVESRKSQAAQAHLEIEILLKDSFAVLLSLPRSGDVDSIYALLDIIQSVTALPDFFSGKAAFWKFRNVWFKKARYTYIIKIHK